ncbi:hypothetical protein GRS66_005564 [Saccharomyces pastorianus]|uniref:Uncharacterized protein n=1 Tax=Saccharomyces pastorianus TaxID=27292 RepID=A0A6C1E1E2_SACPS|nr:hypothetical protein GRS66_005564 [Saccharomyces pastorianus]
MKTFTRKTAQLTVEDGDDWEVVGKNKALFDDKSVHLYLLFAFPLFRGLSQAFPWTLSKNSSTIEVPKNSYNYRFNAVLYKDKAASNKKPTEEQPKLSAYVLRTEDDDEDEDLKPMLELKIYKKTAQLTVEDGDEIALFDDKSVHLYLLSFHFQVSQFLI